MSTAEKIVEFEKRLLDQETFHEMLLLERRRTERSRKPFALMLLRLDTVCPNASSDSGFIQELTHKLFKCTRETDIKGWYDEPGVVGVMLCESCSFNGDGSRGILDRKLFEELRPYFHSDEERDRSLSFHIFPEDHDPSAVFSEPDLSLYPDLTRRGAMSRPARFAKRAMDIAGSLAIIVGFLPVILVVSLLIKTTSRGPVFFRQERVGQFGRRFVMLKYRSMFHKCDCRSHQEFMVKFIKPKGEECAAPADVDGEEPVYKEQNDPRITPVGRWLRKTSFDELPQLFNVLKGDMSLVGPRPPIAYEVECYDIWHRRRILEMKPGITGLWQVTGRSRTTFDELVRLDLQYTREWSLWLDVKILLMTPIVAITGRGGY